MTTINITLEQILRLSKIERLSVVQYILDSIQQEEDVIISDEWKKELDRRMELYFTGKTQLHSWEQVVVWQGLSQ